MKYKEEIADLVLLYHAFTNEQLKDVTAKAIYKLLKDEIERNEQ